MFKLSISTKSQDTRSSGEATMPENSLRSVRALISSVVGNLVMAGSFLQALLAPGAFTELIFRSGPLIFLIEIFSFYGSVFVLGGADTDRALFEKSGRLAYRYRLQLFVLFLVVTIAMGYGFKNWFIPGFFFVSIATKIFATGHDIEQFKRTTGRVTVGFFGVMLLSFFIAEHFYPLWQSLFPIPIELMEYKLTEMSGSIIDHPQTLLVWGVVYFMLNVLLDIFFFWRSVRKRKMHV